MGKKKIAIRFDPNKGWMLDEPERPRMRMGNSRSTCGGEVYVHARNPMNGTMLAAKVPDRPNYS